MKSTKELARELGFLKKRAPRSANASTGKRHLPAHTKASRVGQAFSYVIVIDFESTCWKDKKNTSQEIIEFPAVLLNTSNGYLESEFHQYVMPDENPMLSDFCQEFTGITQEQVERGVPLFICLNRFSQWLKKIESEKNVAYNSSTDGSKKLCTFVTWSDWDLGVCLHYECQRKQLYKPCALNHWIDARAVYRNFYQRKPKGLSGALQEVGIEFAGRQHSGLDDARNTARLVWRMIQDGCQLNITKTIKSGRPVTVTKGFNQQTFMNQQPKDDRELPATAAASKATSKVVTNSQQTSAGNSTAKKHPVKRRSDSAPGHSRSGGGMHAGGAAVMSGKKGPFRIYEEPAKPVTCAVGTADQQQVSSSDEEQCTGKKICCTLENRNDGNVCGPSSGSVEGRRGRTCSDSDEALRAVQDSPDPEGNVQQGQMPSHETPNQTCKLKGGFKTPPAYNIPFFNQNSITRYSNAGEKTQAFTNRTSPTDQQSSGFKTPANPGSRTPFAFDGHDSSGLKTPSSTTPQSTNTKITPPLCKCGRRSKRRVTVRPGPNQGRAFYSCPGHRRSGSSTNVKVSALKDTTNSRTGCGFFSWESAVLGGRGSLGEQSGLSKLGLSRSRTPSPLSSALIKKTAWAGITLSGSIQNVITQRAGQSNGTSLHIYGGVSPIGTLKGNNW